MASNVDAWNEANNSTQQAINSRTAANQATRKFAELFLSSLGVADVLVNFYAIYPPMAIALLPLAFYCLVITYTDEQRNSDRN